MLQNAPNRTEIKEHMRTVEDATTFGNILSEFADACMAANTQRNYEILRGCHNAMEDLVLHYKQWFNNNPIVEESTWTLPPG